MNRLRGFILFSVLAVITAHAEETNVPATASVTSNAAPSGAMSNALPDTITIDGTTYEEVRWQRVTPATVTIFHKTGVAAIPLWKLPPDLQERFGYDANKASQWRDAEQRTYAGLAEQKHQEEERKRKEKEEETQPLTGKDLIAWKLARQNAERVIQHRFAPSGWAQWDFSDSPPLKKYMRINAIGDWEFLFKGHGVNYNANGDGLTREGSIVVTVTQMGNQLRVVLTDGDKAW
jgi:hypothetical protein